MFRCVLDWFLRQWAMILGFYDEECELGFYDDDWGRHEPEQDDPDWALWRDCGGEG